jgi:hypothetical protein
MLRMAFHIIHTRLRNTPQPCTGPRMIGKGEGVVKPELTPAGYNFNRFNHLIFYLCHCSRSSILAPFDQ